MLNEEEKIRKELIRREEQLLENDIRNDAPRIAELVAAECLEITESGKQSSYKPGESFGALDGVFYIDSNTIRMISLADGCKLVSYIAAKVKKNVRMKSNCSSIWKKTDNAWKIVFHQRTNCSEA